MQNMNDKTIDIQLSKDEALVLFEFLSRFDEILSRFDEIETLSIDKGEEVALWHLHGHLEAILVEPFQSTYMEDIKSARERLRIKFDGIDTT
jgi:hypothetical protein